MAEQVITDTTALCDALRRALLRLGPKVRLAFIYGSLARGDEREDSDIDLLLIGDVTTLEAVRALWGVRNRVDRELNPNVYSVDEFREWAHKGHYFIAAAIAEPKLWVIGNEDELRGLGGQTPSGTP